MFDKGREGINEKIEKRQPRVQISTTSMLISLYSRIESKYWVL